MRPKRFVSILIIVLVFIVIGGTYFAMKLKPNPARPDYNAQIIDALNTGQTVKKIDNPLLQPPPNINRNQILNYFQLGNIYFALVMQNSMNVVLNTPKDYTTTFTGILISKQGESQWTSFTKIKDRKSADKNNPYYLWTDSKQLLLSVVDQNGAGSGEGLMKLFTFTSDGSWKLTGCYFFGKTYNTPEISGDYFTYSSKLSKQTSRPLTECDNVILTSFFPHIP